MELMRKFTVLGIIACGLINLYSCTTQESFEEATDSSFLNLSQEEYISIAFEHPKEITEDQAITLVKDFSGKQATRSISQSPIIEKKYYIGGISSKSVEDTVSSIPIYQLKLSEKEGFALVAGDERFATVIAFAEKGNLADTTQNKSVALMVREAENAIKSKLRYYNAIRDSLHDKTLCKLKTAFHTNDITYHDVKEKIKVDFRSFIQVAGVDAREFRQQKIDISQYTGIIFTSRGAIDHYFRLAEELRFQVPDSMRYICQSEAVANYLQKHIVYRKRKISFGEKTVADMLPLFKKYPDEKYLLPCSDVMGDDIPKVLDSAGIDWTKAVMYKTVSTDLSDIKPKDYDMLVFFSPQGIKSLFKNFEDFKQGDKKIGVFGEGTRQAAEEAGLRVDVMAPTKETPSMAMAIEKYISNGK